MYWIQPVQTDKILEGGDGEKKYPAWLMCSVSAADKKREREVHLQVLLNL